MATPLTRAEWLDECAKLAKTYEEAMTDEAKALVERMEEWALTLLAACEGGDLGTDEPVALMYQARDRIEALEAALSWALIQLGSETGYNMESPIWHAYDRARSVLNGEK